MQRDMELIRKILFALEDQYKPGDGLLFGLNVDGYDIKTIAEHCDLLCQQGLITNFIPVRGGDTVIAFQVGNLSSSGYDYLELIRNEEIWDKTKKELKKEKLPQTFEAIARIAGIFIGEVIKGLNT
jgi:hypothetical protein